MDVSCPQCGNPNLDVDAANSVVFCRNCGFAVRVDPQSGEVTPLNQGGGPAAAPEAYREKMILGTDPLTFFLGGTAVLLLLTVLNMFSFSVFVVLEVLLVIFWWYNR